MIGIVFFCSIFIATIYAGCQDSDHLLNCANCLADASEGCQWCTPGASQNLAGVCTGGTGLGALLNCALIPPVTIAGVEVQFEAVESCSNLLDCAAHAQDCESCKSDPNCAWCPAILNATVPGVPPELGDAGLCMYGVQDAACKALNGVGVEPVTEQCNANFIDCFGATDCEECGKRFGCAWCEGHDLAGDLNIGWGGLGSCIPDTDNNRQMCEGHDNKEWNPSPCPGSWVKCISTIGCKQCLDTPGCGYCDGGGLMPDLPIPGVPNLGLYQCFPNSTVQQRNCEQGHVINPVPGEGTTFLVGDDATCDATFESCLIKTSCSQCQAQSGCSWCEGAFPPCQRDVPSGKSACEANGNEWNPQPCQGSHLGCAGASNNCGHCLNTQDCGYCKLPESLATSAVPGLCVHTGSLAVGIAGPLACQGLGGTWNPPDCASITPPDTGVPSPPTTGTDANCVLPTSWCDSVNQPQCDPLVFCQRRCDQEFPGQVTDRCECGAPASAGAPFPEPQYTCREPGAISGQSPNPLGLPFSLGVLIAIIAAAVCLLILLPLLLLAVLLRRRQVVVKHTHTSHRHSHHSRRYYEGRSRRSQRGQSRRGPSSSRVAGTSDVAMHSMNLAMNPSTREQLSGRSGGQTMNTAMSPAPTYETMEFQKNLNPGHAAAPDVYANVSVAGASTAADSEYQVPQQQGQQSETGYAQVPTGTGVDN